jgi:dihydrofolate synthase/folylpolyglutamate synthase
VSTKWGESLTNSEHFSPSSADPVTEPSVPFIENRNQAVSFLDSRIGTGVTPGLDRIAGLLAYMGDPQRDYPSIHVAGTNGKTTVSRMVQQILGSHGLATGAFTSPHLETVEERFNLHGVQIDPRDFTDAVADIAWFVEGYERENDTTVTYFEVTAALAFSLFSTAAVDVGVVEVGLGGRLDATNVLEAAVSVVTTVDIDHVEFLGDTIRQIAVEKVAVVKDGGTVVTGDLPPDAIAAVEQRVAETGANWIRFGSDFGVSDAVVAVGGWHCNINGVHGEYEDLFLRIHGRHQVDNLATAIATCEMFMGRPLDADVLSFAVASITSPGRLEIVRRRPLVLIDGAHNVQGFGGLGSVLRDEFPPMRWHLVLGVRGDRSISDLLAPLEGHVAHVYAAAPDDEQAIDPTSIATDASDALGTPSTVHESVTTALAEAVSAAGPDGGVIVAGSLYVAGEARASFDVSGDRSGEAHVRVDAEVVDAPDDEFDESDLFD